MPIPTKDYIFNIFSLTFISKPIGPLDSVAMPIGTVLNARRDEGLKK